jgi:hypothetical protein
MLDTSSILPRDAALDAARCLVFDHGHHLAEAVRLIGGPSAEALVIDLGVRLTHASRMTDRIRRDLVALHRLLALEEGPDFDPAETILLSKINLLSPQVEDICLLTDLLGDLLEAIAPHPLLLPPAPHPSALCFPPRHAA